MSGSRRPAWLRALAVPLGDPVAACVLPVADPDHPPPLELPDDVERIPVRLDADGLEPFPQGDLPDPILVAPPAVPARARDVRCQTAEGVELTGEAAVLAKWLSGPLEGRRAAVFVTRSLLVSPERASFRAWLDRAVSVGWVLFPGPEGAQALGVPGLEMAILVAGPGEETGGVRLTRLADLESTPPEEWSKILELATRRQGGEAHGSIVLRDQALGSDAWTYRRYSREFRETRADAAALGDSMALQELAEVVEGLGPKDLTAFVRESHSGTGEPTVAVFGRRSLADGELGRPTHMLAEHLALQEMRLDEGDLLVSVHPESGRHALAVVPVSADALPATFEADLLAVRFGDDVAPRIRELVRGYLGSPHALEWLEAQGALPRVKRRHLERLAVPSPKEDVLEALEGLAEAEREYLDWAREAREARAELFARSSFADTVPRLLERQRLERERVQAGRDSRSLDYLVRNYYPHPVAVRRESLLQKAHGETRAREAQECAEIAVSLVSFLALAQWRALEGPEAPDFPPHLAQYVQGNRFTFDWGKHRTFVDAVLAASRKHENPLTLPIPELATLEVGSEAPWSEAEAALREARNQAAHLYRPSPTEAQVLSERMEENLCTLLESLAFLSSARLAVVRDYSRDALTGEREARVQVLAGASRVFPRERLEVDEELARGAVGLFDAGGRFHSLTPWLVWQHCKRCEQPELFAFARYEDGRAEYVALATGHPWSAETSGRYWQRVMETV